MPTGSSERLLALYAFLLTRERPADRETIRGSIEAYRETVSEEAFERAFERDKAALRGMGLPLRTVALDAGPAYALDREGLWLPPVEFTTRQRLLLGLAARLWEDPRHVRENAGVLRRLGVGTEEAGDGDAVLPLREAGPDGAAVAAAGATPLTADEGLDLVLDALARGDSLAFDYRTGDGLDSMPRRLSPWGIGRRYDHWYVHGWDPDRGAPRLFRLSRMSGTRAVAGRGRPAPEGLSMDEVLEGVARVRGPVLALRPAGEERHVVRDWIEDARAVRPAPVPPEEPSDGSSDVQGEAGFSLEILDAAEFVRCLAELRRPWEIASRTLSETALEGLRTQSLCLIQRRAELQEALRAAREAGEKPLSEAPVRPRHREPVNERFARLADMIADLSGEGPVELGELAARYGTTRKQTVRDVRTLTEAGDVLEQGTDLRVDSRDGQVWLRFSSPEIHRVRLGARQTLRLLLALRLLSQVVPERREELEQITALLSRTLPREAPGEQSLSVKVEGDQQDRLDALRRALAQDRAVRLLYRSRGQETATTRVVLPERLEPAERTWHLQGRDAGDGGRRTYRLDAIQEIHDAGPADRHRPDESPEPDSGTSSRTIAPTVPEAHGDSTRTGVDAGPSAILWAAGSGRSLVAGPLAGQLVGTLDLGAPWGAGGLWRVPVRDASALDRIQRRRGGELGVWEATPETLLRGLGA